MKFDAVVSCIILKASFGWIWMQSWKCKDDISVLAYYWTKYNRTTNIFERVQYKKKFLNMLCFVESKTEHVSSFTCSLSWWFHVRVLNEENRVLWAWCPWTEIESVRLDFHVQKPSPLDSISMCRNRVQWTWFPSLRGQLSSPKSSPLDSNC